MTDGVYRKVNPDRGGDVEPTTHMMRLDLSDTYHGIHESPDKMRPDGIRCRTPYYVPTSPADPQGF